ncbi:hypothetical protein HC341_13535 [Aquisalimonas sp. 2447]|uniref:hypothetical protein n=1 Tax=Aquisalimonas sp. 2447 TaxID=2740807 RepID=UPI0014323E1A|nr:hypothetical protein [Aquisalimonas sp. 2447]QIT56125.1 hypothetical protein HC341_13535 [Aquisalimonas sp. 2447]
MTATAQEWNWLDFDAERVRALLAHASQCSQHEPTADQMLEARFRHPEAPKPPRGELPPREHLALDAVPAGLQVCIGDGLCLVSNGIGGEAPAPVFAPGCDPRQDGDWRATVEAAAGVEQQVLFLPADAVDEVLAEAGDRVWLGLRRDEERFGVEEYGLSPTANAPNDG